MKPSNLLFILSDQHARDAAGCYGHPLVQTPHLDALAARGVRFAHACTNCPICVPARASLATGRYVHQIGYWDNAFAYDGRVPSWGHRLRAQGHRVDSIGKLHFRRRGEDHGFSREIDPLHVVEGVGDILGCLRDAPPVRKKGPGITGAGPGDSTYLQYDARNAEAACRWLRQAPAKGRPWLLFVGFVCPHPPYIAPPELCELYPQEQVPLRPQWRREDWPEHPALARFRRVFDFDQGFDEATIRRLTATYYGVCTYLDRQIGRLLRALEENGLEQNTRIVYTSDHGESLGGRGIFGKFTLYEEAAAVPLIIAGPGVPEGKVVQTPVSLVDCFPSAIEALGAAPAPGDQELPGDSLWKIAAEPGRQRTVFGEYHAVGSQHAAYMLRNRTHKYIHYVGAPPQLFDLQADPQECENLAEAPPQRARRRRFEHHLEQMLDPEAVDARARADQRAKIEAFGGEEAVRRRGAFDNSPVPGEAPAFRRPGRPN